MDGRGEIWNINGVGGVTGSSVLKFITEHERFGKDIQILKTSGTAGIENTITIYIDRDYVWATFFAELKAFLDERWPDRNEPSDWARRGAIYYRVADAEVL